MEGLYNDSSKRSINDLDNNYSKPPSEKKKSQSGLRISSPRNQYGKPASPKIVQAEGLESNPREPLEEIKQKKQGAGRPGGSSSGGTLIGVGKQQQQQDPQDHQGNQK